MTEPAAPATTVDAPEAVQQQPEPPQDANTLPAWARESLTKANQEAAKYRTQVNELKPLADQFRQLEEASKSEAQRLAEAAETARSEAAQARADMVRYKAAATHRIPAEHFDLLGTGTEDEISARAEKLANLLAAQAAAQQPPAATAPPTRPVEQLRPGASPAGITSEDDAVYAALFGPPK